MNKNTLDKEEIRNFLKCLINFTVNFLLVLLLLIFVSNGLFKFYLYFYIAPEILDILIFNNNFSIKSWNFIHNLLYSSIMGSLLIWLIFILFCIYNFYYESEKERLVFKNLSIIILILLALNSNKEFLFLLREAIIVFLIGIIITYILFFFRILIFKKKKIEDRKNSERNSIYNFFSIIILNIIIFFSFQPSINFLIISNLICNLYFLNLLLFNYIEKKIIIFKINYSFFRIKSSN